MLESRGERPGSTDFLRWPDEEDMPWSGKLESAPGAMDAEAVDGPAKAAVASLGFEAICTDRL